MEPIEKPMDVAVEIPNLVDVWIEIGFHDQLVMSNMEIVEHLVMEGDDSYVADMDVSGVDSLVADVVEDLHDTADLYVHDVELLVVDMVEGLHVSHVANSS